MKLSAPESRNVRKLPVIASRTIAVTVVCFATLASASTFAFLDRNQVEQLGGAATQYVPKDGLAQNIVDNTGAIYVVESARTNGVADILALPDKAAANLFGSLGESRIRSAQIWRQTSTPIKPGQQTTDLHELDSKGLSILATYGGTISFVYNPPLVELPANVAAGASWSNKGDALPNSILTYTSQSKALEPSNSKLIEVSGLTKAQLRECIQVDSSSKYFDKEITPLIEIEQSDLWCKGKGKVAIVGTINGTKITQGPLADASKAVSSSDVAAVPINWQDPQTWAESKAAIGYTDPFYREQSLSLGMAVNPIRTSGGLVVVSSLSGDNLVALKLSQGKLERSWFAHPGGSILTISTIGDTILATTSERELVAYNQNGIRIWSKPESELVTSTPATRTGSDGATFAVASLDGTVQLIEAQTGRVIWQRKIPADVSSPPIESKEILVVSDRSGKVWAFSLKDGTERWTNQTNLVLLGTALNDSVYLAEDQGLLRAFAIKDGKREWSRQFKGNVRTVLAVNENIVVVTDEELIAVDANTGQVKWRNPGAQSAISNGSKLIAFTESKAELIDSTGKVIHEWDIPSLATEISRFEVAGANGFFSFVSYKEATVVGAP
ncbi:MAG: PQQ-binding-like beta-propeller repeat protein [Cryobacterium sp.]|nr:PQQ-binding-like beta-propeller repeat protein [Cryobacterium sp.]